ncbi:MAG: hypothetical protein ACJA1F_000164 [Paracoccaceae bacterium]|jgi:hypothetical protein
MVEIHPFLPTGITAPTPVKRSVCLLNHTFAALRQSGTTITFRYKKTALEERRFPVM